MALYFNGLNLLDSNRYDSIMIKGLLTEEKQDFQVDIKALKPDFKNQPVYFKFHGQSVMPKFSEQIKGMTDAEKVIEIVKKYLEYSEVSEIRDLSRLPHYKGWFNIIRGTRNLYLQIYGSEVKVIPPMVIKKYLDDRLIFLTNNEDINLYKIELNHGLTSYKKEKVNDKERICLNLFYGEKNDKIADFDQQFLKDFIFDKLNQVGEEAKLVCITSVTQFTPSISGYGFHIICGDLVICLNGMETLVLEQIKPYLQEYNESLKQSKVMQLKLEGF